MSGGEGTAKRRSCGAALARLAGEAQVINLEGMKCSSAVLKIVLPTLHLLAQEALKKPNDGIWSKPVCDEDLMKFESHSFYFFDSDKTSSISITNPHYM